ncbi:hypothetical protein H0H93_010887 [Arthromyces matolae]|nr:hypothetical protein H0H93_010887 [Arthromyces matolae]
MLILKVVEENPTLDKNAGWSGQKEAKVASIFDELLAHGKFQHIANSNKKTYWIFALKVKGQTLPNVPGLSDVNPRAIQQLQAAAKSLLAARRLKIDPWAFKQEQNWVYHMGNNKKPVAVFWPQRWAGAGGHNWVGALLSLLPGQSGPVPVELPDNDSVDWVITMMKKEFTKEERARYDAGSN